MFHVPPRFWGVPLEEAETFVVCIFFWTRAATAVERFAIVPSSWEVPSTRPKLLSVCWHFGCKPTELFAMVATATLAWRPSAVSMTGDATGAVVTRRGFVHFAPT